MIYLKEITKWQFPNHIYMLNSDGKAVGYIKENTEEKIFFKSPKIFYKTHRKFKEVKHV